MRARQLLLFLWFCRTAQDIFNKSSTKVYLVQKAYSGFQHLKMYRDAAQEEKALRALTKYIAPRHRSHLTHRPYQHQPWM